jgi:hypothetical protein
MAQAAGTTDSAIRQGSSALNSLVNQNDGQPQLNEEVLKALETYKKKDSSKGQDLLATPLRFKFELIVSVFYSRGTV